MRSRGSLAAARAAVRSSPRIARPATRYRAAGVRFWSDRELEDIGLDALLGLDLFPVRPLVVSAQASAGNLGQAAVGSARIQLGVAFRRFELLAGVEWLWIGDVELSSPLVGMRLWL